MKKFNRILLAVLVLMLSISLLASCSGKKNILDSTDTAFKYSYGIDKDGYWNGVKALKNVKLCDYMGITIPADVHVIADEAIQVELDAMLANFTEPIEVTDRPIVTGDTINIDFVGSVDGVEFEGGSTGGNGTVVTIGETQYIDDFLEQLIGHTPGESFDIEVTFPDDYSNEDLEGKDAVFAITLNYIVGELVPELNDAFVAENLSASYGWNTVDEMKAAIYDNLQGGAIEEYLRNYILENSTVQTLPDILLEYQEFSMLQYYRDYANYYNMEFNEFITAYAGASSEDELINNNISQNTDTANLYLIIQAISEEADITVTDDDAKKFFSDISDDGSHGEYLSTYGMPHLKLVTLQRKVMDYIADNSVNE